MTVFPTHCLEFLKRIYVDTTASVVAIGGLWKTGKTNFGLLIAEEFRKLGWITHFGSNIETDADWIEKIKSLATLKFWSGQNRAPKLFLYDELIESATRRRSMSQLNVDWVRFLPQCSKRHLHIIVLLQTQSFEEENLADSVWFTRTFNRGQWMKLSKTTATFSSVQLGIGSYRLEDIPPTRIGYDADLSASFGLTDEIANFDVQPVVLKVGKLYGDGQNLQKIAEYLGLPSDNRSAPKRYLTKYCKITSEMLFQSGESKEREILKVMEKEGKDIEKTTS